MANVMAAIARQKVCVLPNLELEKYGLKIAPTWRKASVEEIFAEMLKIVLMIKNGQKVKLICWCKQLKRDVACHADSLEAFILWMLWAGF
jgi:hypothetical protein